MNPPSIRRMFLFVPMVMSLSQVGPFRFVAVAAGVTDARVKAILDASKTERERVGSVRYKALGEALVPRTSYTVQGQEAPEDHRHAVSVECLVDFRSNRFRVRFACESFNESTERWQPDDTISVYDGDKLIAHRIGVTNNRGKHYAPAQPEFVFHKPTFPTLTMPIAPPLLTHGYCPSGYLYNGENPKHIVAPSPEHFRFHAEAILDDHDCVVLRTARASASTEQIGEIWVEQSVRWPIRRWVILERNNAIASYVNMTYELDGRLAEWTYVQNDVVPNRPPVCTYKLRVQEFEENPTVSLADVQLQPTPGMVVRSDPDGVFYVCGPNGERLSMDTLTAGTASPYQSWIVRLVVLVIIALALIGVVYARMRRRLSKR